jgi:hypothetical protein
METIDAKKYGDQGINAGRDGLYRKDRSNVGIIQKPSQPLSLSKKKPNHDHEAPLSK